MTPLDFSTLSDAQINAAVAEVWAKEHALYLHKEGSVMYISPSLEPDWSKRIQNIPLIPDYATSCDECVKLLNEYHWGSDYRYYYTVVVTNMHDVFTGTEPTFPCAACLAWGRAKGVFV
jgi:hypothetical protein